MQADTFNSLFDTLCELYPKAFSRNPATIRPLKIGILGDLVSERGETFRKPFKPVIGQYQHWPDYLFAVSYGKRRRDLHGNKADAITLGERQKAADELAHLGRWTDDCQKYFDARAKHLQ